MLDLMIKLYLLKSCVQFKMRNFFFRLGPFCLAKPVVASSEETEAQIGNSGKQLLYRRSINNLANTVGSSEVLDKKFTRLSHLKKARLVSPSTTLLFLLLL